MTGRDRHVHDVDPYATDKRPCHTCGYRFHTDRMTEIDVSHEDEYYPNFIYICPNCEEGDE